jgi:hypothetical protein
MIDIPLFLPDPLLAEFLIVKVPGSRVLVLVNLTPEFYIGDTNYHLSESSMLKQYIM